jgi:hypothetical protein
LVSLRLRSATNDMLISSCVAILPPSVRSISPAASTLYLDNEKTTFSLNVPNNSSDVYFYFESPAESWVAMGIGDGMTGALMFIMYSSQDHLRE